MLQGNTYKPKSSFYGVFYSDYLVQVTLLQYYFIFLERSRRYYNVDYYSIRLST